jgi:hypothetical protein
VSLIPLRTVRPTLLAVALAAVVAASLGACSSQAAPSFDPQGPCDSDGQRPGAYPDLEARLPATFDGVAPNRLDSGRNCSKDNLGTLSAHGIQELRFAGGLWETGPRSGVTIAVFAADGLSMARLAEFYETGARTARKTEAISAGEFDVDDVDGRRVDTLNDESYQTIVVLDGPEPEIVRAVLVASDIRQVGTKAAHESVVERATHAAVAP